MKDDRALPAKVVSREESEVVWPDTPMPLDEAWKALESAVARVNLRDARIEGRYWIAGGVVRQGIAREATGYEASAFLVREEDGAIVGGVKSGHVSPAHALVELAGKLDEKAAEVVLREGIESVKQSVDPRTGRA